MKIELSDRDRMGIFEFEDGIRKLPIDSITYVESFGHKAIFHVKDATYIQNRLLKDVESDLADHDFVRVHRSYIVNLKYVRKISNYNLTLHDGYVIPIPRSRYANVKQEYARYIDAAFEREIE